MVNKTAVTYIPKPVYKDTTEVTLMALGNFHYSAAGYHDREELYFGQGAIYATYSEKKVLATLGIGGYTGKYRLVEYWQEPFRLHFHGFLATSEVLFRGTGSKLEFRLGVKMSYAREGGDFARFRKSADADGLFQDVNPANEVLSFAIPCEILFTGKNWSAGLSSIYPAFSIGATFGGTGTLYVNPSVFFTYNRFTILGELYAGLHSQREYYVGGIAWNFARL